MGTGYDQDGYLVEQLIGLGFGNVEIGPVANQEHRTTDDVIQQTDPIAVRYITNRLLRDKKPSDGNIMINIQPSHDIVTALPDLALEDMRICHKKQLGNIKLATLDFTVCDNELKEFLLSDRKEFSEFISNLRQDSIQELGIRIAANVQIHLQKNMTQVEKDNVNDKEIFIRHHTIAANPQNLNFGNRIYCRIDREFSDKIIRNILHCISENNLNGLTINSDSFEETEQLIKRVNSLSKGVLKDPENLKMNLHCRWEEAIQDYNKLKDLASGVDQILLYGKHIESEGPYLLKK